MQQWACETTGSMSGTAQGPGRRWAIAIVTLAVLAVSSLGWPTAAASAADEATNWTEGTNYTLLQPAQPTSVGPGKIEVTEIFSYACPACNAFHETMDKLRKSLPSNAVLDFVPAAFIPTEDWPVFQRAYYTAQELGLLNPRVQDAMYDAVWKSGELAVVDPKTERLRQPAPSIEDAARFYARVTGVSAAKFVAASMSFAVNVKVREANQYIEACGVDQTPTIIVNGKYRLNPEMAGGYDQTIALVKWLVAKESGH